MKDINKILAKAQIATNNSNCVKIIKKYNTIHKSNYTFGTGSICIIIFRFGI
jgi:hypothetical protein